MEALEKPVTLARALLQTLGRSSCAGTFCAKLATGVGGTRTVGAALAAGAGGGMSCCGCASTGTAGVAAGIGGAEAIESVRCEGAAAGAIDSAVASSLACGTGA